MADLFDDPGTIGILGMASGLLNAAGPSRMPVSLGQAMGAGLQRGILDRSQAEQVATQKMLREEQVRQSQEKQKRLQIMDAYVKKFAMTLPPQDQAKLMAAYQMNPEAVGTKIIGTLFPGEDGIMERDPAKQLINKRTGAEISPAGPKPPNAELVDVPMGGKNFQKWWVDKNTQQRIRSEGEIYEKGPLATATASVDASGKAEPAYYQEFGKKEADALVERGRLAKEASASLGGISEARHLLDSGMITGFGADYRVGFGKALQQMGIRYNDDAIANSESFVAAQAKQVAQIIKAFGAGTGLSDADREFAIKAAAGSINMNEASIRRILSINERAFRNVIKDYNKQTKKIPPGTLPYDLSVDEPERTVTRRGTYQGRPVVEYSDGSVEFADGK